jgi:uncharacterized cupredoxin-like copper-binding protein
MRWIQHIFVSAAFAVSSMPALAHESSKHTAKTSLASKTEQKDWGIAGNAKAVKRTIQVRMRDDMRFTPDRIVVRQGETVRFMVQNSGKVMHEFVIGTRQENQAHAKMMEKFPDMEHDEPYMAHVAPGKQGQIVWTFNRPGEFEFACLIAGHYTAGMVGRITVATN